MVLGDLDSNTHKKMKLNHQLNHAQNKLKMHKRFKYKLYTIKVLEENIRRKNSDIPCSKGHKGKNKQMGPHQNKKHLRC